MATGVATGMLALRRLGPGDGAGTGWRVVSAALGMLTITLITRIPFLGGLLFLIAMLLGVGAVLMQMRRSALA